MQGDVKIPVVDRAVMFSREGAGCKENHPGMIFQVRVAFLNEFGFLFLRRVIQGKIDIMCKHVCVSERRVCLRAAPAGCQQGDAQNQNQCFTVFHYCFSNCVKNFPYHNGLRRPCKAHKKSGCVSNHSRLRKSLHDMRDLGHFAEPFGGQNRKVG